MLDHKGYGIVLIEVEIKIAFKIPLQSWLVVGRLIGLAPQMIGIFILFNYSSSSLNEHSSAFHISKASALSMSRLYLNPKLALKDYVNSAFKFQILAFNNFW